MKGLNLGAMSVDELLELRDRVSAILAERVVSERQELESRLARLKSVKVAARPVRKIESDRRSVVVPKYRNPDNPSETWAGRGRQPRWMTAAIKAGRKMSDLRIGDSGMRRPKRKKSR